MVVRGVDISRRNRSRDALDEDGNILCVCRLHETNTKKTVKNDTYLTKFANNGSKSFFRFDSFILQQNVLLVVYINYRKKSVVNFLPIYAINIVSY